MSEDLFVGENFKVDLLQKARDITVEVIEQAAKLIQPGMTELDAKKIIQQIQKDLGAPRAWHAPQIRFGENTVLSYGEKPKEGVTLKENDIYYLDLGPIFGEHEGDVGRTFAIGTDKEMKKCAKDVGEIWFEVRDHWKKTKSSGRDLYIFAEECAKKRGWDLILKGASGHRVADFPHIAKKRGNLEKQKNEVVADRWILEIQIRHPEKPFGAFFEDLLN